MSEDNWKNKKREQEKSLFKRTHQQYDADKLNNELYTSLTDEEKLTGRKKAIYLATRHSGSITNTSSRHRNSRLEIYLFKLGYVYDVDLHKVARLINVSPQIIYAVVGDPIRNIGAPDDMRGFAYSDQIFDLFPKVTNGTIRVGIISAPIYNNFFSRVNGNNSVIISLNQSDELCQKAGKTKEEYITQSIISRMLWLLFRDTYSDKDIYHDDTRGCIFDFCAQKNEKVHKLKASMIDPVCKGRLIEANIPESILHTTEKILKRLRIPSFGDVFLDSLQKPWFSFLVGGLIFGTIINVISSLILGEFDSLNDFLVALFLLTMVVIIIVVNYLNVLKSFGKESPD